MSLEGDGKGESTPNVLLKGEEGIISVVPESWKGAAHCRKRGRLQMAFGRKKDQLSIFLPREQLYIWGGRGKRGSMSLAQSK